MALETSGNTSESHGRRSTRLEAIIDLAVALGYFRAEELAKLEAIRDECAKTVYGLIRKFADPQPAAV